MLGVGNCEQDVMTKHVPRGVIIQAEIGGKESKDDRRPSKIFRDFSATRLSPHVPGTYRYYMIC
jgi:hypothetical protein